MKREHISEGMEMGTMFCLFGKGKFRSLVELSYGCSLHDDFEEVVFYDIYDCNKFYMHMNITRPSITLKYHNS